MDGDWTTWEGLAEENSFEPVVFGQRTKPAARNPSPAKKSTAAPKPKGFVAGVSERGIQKKKKKNRCAGLMKVAESPVAAVDSDDDEAFEEPSAPSPYIIDSKNPYAALGDLMDAEEAEEAREAEEKAKAEAAAAKKAEATKKAAKGDKKDESFIEAVAASPIVRRTRGALKAFSTTFEKVVDFVKNSPQMVERTRSVRMLHHVLFLRHLRTLYAFHDLPLLCIVRPLRSSSLTSFYLSLCHSHLVGAGVDGDERECAGRPRREGSGQSCQGRAGCSCPPLVALAADRLEASPVRLILSCCTDQPDPQPHMKRLVPVRMRAFGEERARFWTCTIHRLHPLTVTVWPSPAAADVDEYGTARARYLIVFVFAQPRQAQAPAHVFRLCKASPHGST